VSDVVHASAGGPIVPPRAVPASISRPRSCWQPAEALCASNSVLRRRSRSEPMLRRREEKSRRDTSQSESNSTSQMGSRQPYLDNPSKLGTAMQHRDFPALGGATQRQVITLLNLAKASEWNAQSRLRVGDKGRDVPCSRATLMGSSSGRARKNVGQKPSCFTMLARGRKC
jgi:hypothetical protein